MTQNPFPSMPFWTVKDFAEHLGVNEKTVRRRIKEGTLVAHRFGRQIRIAKRDAAAFIARSRKS